MKIKNEKSKYRQRGYYCDVCDITSCVYGNDPEPKVLCNSITPRECHIVKEWDHMIDEAVICTPFVDVPKA